MKIKRNYIRNLFKITSYFLLGTVIFVLIVAVLIQTAPVQRYAKNKAINYLRSKIETKIEMQTLHLSLWSGVTIENFYAEDQLGDTLVYAQTIRILPSLRAFTRGDLNLRTVYAGKLKANLKEVSDGVLNFQYIADAFASKTTDTLKSESDFYLFCKNLNIKDCAFSYRTLSATDTIKGMDFNDLKLKNINLNSKDFELFNTSVRLKIDSLSAVEKSGFNLKKLSGDTIQYSDSEIYFSGISAMTNNSNLQFNNISLKYTSPDAFTHFTDSVRMKISAHDSCYLKLNDLQYFTDALGRLDNTLQLSGTITGTVNDLQTRHLKLGLDKIVSINLDSELKQVTDPKKLRFNLTVNELKINLSDLKTLKLRNDSALVPELPKELDDLAKISYTGNSEGETSDFTTQGTFTTNIGKITLEIRALQDETSMISLEGNIRANELEINKIIDNPDFGKISFFQNIKFQYTRDKKINLKTEGKIDSLMFKKFTYKAINMYAEMHDLNIDSASLILNQPHVKASLSAKADFSSKIPKITFDILADTLDLKAMNIEPKFKKSFLRFGLNGKFRGINLADFQGDIHFTQPFRYTNDTLNLRIDTFKLVSTTTAEQHKNITLNSDIFKAEIKQQGNLNQMSKHFDQKLSSLFPTFFRLKDTISTPETTVWAEFSLLLKKPNIITDFFYPGLRIARNTTFSGRYVPETDSLSFNADIAAVLAEGVHLDSVTLRAYTEDKKLAANLFCKKIEPSTGIFFSNLELKTQILNDSVQYSLAWDNKDTIRYAADIKGLFSISKFPNSKELNLKTTLFPSQVIVEDSLWQIEQTEFELDSMFLNINNLHISSNIQHLRLDGSILLGDVAKSSVSDISELVLENFNIANFKPLLGDDVTISGNLSGTTRIIQPLGKPLIFTDNNITDLSINNINLGILFLKSDWLAEENKIRVNMYIQRGNDSIGNVVKVIEANGFYKPSNDSLMLATNIKALKTNIFKSYFTEYITMGRSSQLGGEITLSGTTSDWKLSGEARLQSFSAFVLETNTLYNSSAGDIVLRFNNSEIELLPSKLTSGKRNEKADLSGIIKHNNFDKFVTDISLDFENLLLYNTEETDTAYFYGTIYGTGNVKISGPPENMKIVGNIETNKNTRIFIPLSGEESLNAESGFIEFVTAATDETDINADSKNTEYTVTLTGMTINLDVKLTPEADIQIIMDKRTGSAIKARGTSDMKVTMDTRGDINTYGDFVIEKGKYNFSLEGIINKEFTVEKGSKISLHGNPEEDIDMQLKTVYTLRKVPVVSLMAEEQYSGIYSTANCLITMNGNITSPTVDFEVILTDTDEDVARQIRNLDAENKNIQFLSLLMISKFQPLPGFSQEVVGGSVVNTGDVLTAQLNRLLADVSENFDLGVNYAQGDQASSDEIELALSTNLWDDRITINGNVGVGGQSKDPTLADNTGNVVGEIEAELKLNRQGTFKMKMYNKANDDLEYDKAPYTQGLGIFWRKSFDSIFPHKIKNDSVK